METKIKWIPYDKKSRSVPTQRGTYLVAGVRVTESNELDKIAQVAYWVETLDMWTGAEGIAIQYFARITLPD